MDSASFAVRERGKSMSDREYFELRATEEERRATEAADGRAAAVHAELADAYRTRLARRGRSRR